MSRPVVAEVVGAAGAGKTTLLARLRATPQEIESISDLKSVSNIPPYLNAARRSLSYVLHSGLMGNESLPFAAWHRVNRVRAALSILSCKSGATGHLVVADQGPLYSLMTLMPYVEACQSTAGSGCMPIWWSRLLAEVASQLDLIVWLDADEATLLRRVRDRDKAHRIKNLPDRQAMSYLREQRRRYAWILQIFQSTQGAKVLIWTERQGGIDACVQRIRAAADGFSSDLKSSTATSVSS